MTVTAVRDLRISRGSAGSHAFECDDGKAYFVKFKDETRTVVNEHVGYSLAKLLDMPVPERNLVMVSQSLIDDSETLAKKRGIRGGIHHGTVWMENCVDFRNVIVRGIVLANAATLPGLVVLDNLILNMDRNNPGNNLLQMTESGLEYKTVDFSEILSGRNWTVETIRSAERDSHLMPVFTVVALTVRGLPSFSPWLETTEALSAETVTRILAEIPESWNVTGEEKEAVSRFLLMRKDMVRGILLANRARFLNWK